MSSPPRHPPPQSGQTVWCHEGPEPVMDQVVVNEFPNARMEARGMGHVPHPPASPATELTKCTSTHGGWGGSGRLWIIFIGCRNWLSNLLRTKFLLGGSVGRPLVTALAVHLLLSSCRSGLLGKTLKPKLFRRVRPACHIAFFFHWCALDKRLKISIWKNI